MKLTNLAIKSLGNEDTHALSTTTIEIATPHFALFEPSTQAAFELLKTSTSQLGFQLNRSRASLITKDINAKNKQADKVWKEIKSVLTRTAKSVVDASKAKTAEELIDFLKPYWKTEGLAQKTQVSNFVEMFAKYDTAWKAKGKTAGIDAAMQLLETTNKEMGDLWQQRNDLQGDLSETLPATSLRDQTASLLSRFGTLIESQQQFAPNPALASMIADMNEARSKYSALIATRKTIRDNKKKSANK